MTNKQQDSFALQGIVIAILIVVTPVVVADFVSAKQMEANAKATYLAGQNVGQDKYAVKN